MPGLVVGVPGLGLELKKYGNPLAGPREIEQESPVLINPVVTPESTRIPLIHMNIMNTVARHKTEYLIGLVLRTPALAEGVNERIFVSHCPLYELIDFLVQIIIRTGCAEREHTHVPRIEQVATNKIQRYPTWLRWKRKPTEGLVDQFGKKGMIESGVHKKLKLGRRELRGDIHRDAKVCRIIDDVDLVMWFSA
jgi:hypothetical protein